MKTKSLIKLSIFSAAISCASLAWADVSMADSHFLQKAAQAGNFEVKASEMALKKTKNADVQAFAQHMVDDHKKAGEELKALADKKKVKVSAEPSFTQKTSLMLLEKKDGKNFDSKYAEDVGVDAHESTIKLFEKVAKSGDDPEVKEFANKTLPTLNHHLEQAKALESSVKKEK